MAWDVRQTYYYLVCFATLIMVIVGVVQTVENGLDLAFPQEPYRLSAVDMYDRLQRPGTETSNALTRAEIEEMAEEESERQRRDAQRRALRNLIGSVALMAVAAPVYLFHWRRVRHDDATRSDG